MSYIGTNNGDDSFEGHGFGQPGPFDNFDADDETPDERVTRREREHRAFNELRELLDEDN